MSGILSPGTYDGFGLRVEDVGRPEDDIVRNARLDLFILEIFYTSSLSFSKLAVLAFYCQYTLVPLRLPIRLC